MRQCLFFIVCVFIVLSGCVVPDSGPVSSWEECVDGENVLLRTYPPQCVTREGMRFSPPETSEVPGE